MHSGCRDEYVKETTDKRRHTFTHTHYVVVGGGVCHGAVYHVHEHARAPQVAEEHAAQAASRVSACAVHHQRYIRQASVTASSCVCVCACVFVCVCLRAHVCK